MTYEGCPVDGTTKGNTTNTVTYRTLSRSPIPDKNRDKVSTPSFPIHNLDSEFGITLT